jgi:hypothetical protein
VRRPQAERAEAERKAIADAQKIVAIWNARQAGPDPAPAITSRGPTPFLSFGPHVIRNCSSDG